MSSEQEAVRNLLITNLRRRAGEKLIEIRKRACAPASNESVTQRQERDEKLAADFNGLLDQLAVMDPDNTPKQRL
jgi:hypothetical protein